MVRVLTALAKKVDLVNSTYRSLHGSVSPAPGYVELLFGFHRYQACRRYTYIHEGNIQTHKIKISLSKINKGLHILNRTVRHEKKKKQKRI